MYYLLVSDVIIHGFLVCSHVAVTEFAMPLNWQINHTVDFKLIYVTLREETGSQMSMFLYIYALKIM